MTDRRPLGVFDSGLGGLTVVRALRRELPEESIVYLGDTARVPYGTRSAETVVRYALACARVLVQRDVKALVVACGTVSSVAIEALRIELDLPVLGVIEPSARAAVDAAKGRTIGILGTPGTVASNAYPKTIGTLSTRAEVVQQAAPLFVPLAEEGWTEGDVPRLAAERYLSPLVEKGARVVVLGCTHYPLLKPVIEAEADRLAGEPVTVIDTGTAVALAVRAFLKERRRATDAAGPGTLELLVTDVPKTFAEVGSRFLGEDVGEVRQIDLTSLRFNPCVTGCSSPSRSLRASRARARPVPLRRTIPSRGCRLRPTRRPSFRLPRRPPPPPPARGWTATPRCASSRARSPPRGACTSPASSTPTRRSRLRPSR